MIELEDALARILAALPDPAIERAALREAHHRVLAEKICAPIDLPPFDNSAMDGYAVRATDVEAATTGLPVRLRLRGTIPAGEQFAGEMAGGECVRLFTGSPLPRGADAVVMQEDVRPDGPDGSEVQVLDAVKPWENVRLRGDDVKVGEALVEAGDLLLPARIGLLAASGISTVSVGKRPVVGLLATGSELRNAGQPLEPGRIYESNRIALAALAQRAGALPRTLPLVPDTLIATQTALAEAFSECDVVVTSGGASVGELDFVRTAFEKLGGELQFWKVAVRPGKPFVFGRWRGKLLFGLPGNPVSAFVTFLLLAHPALLRWQGARDAALPAYPGVLGETLANPGERRHFMRVRVDPAGKILLAGPQASHALGSLALANGLVDVPPRTTLVKGTNVTVIRWD